MRLLLRFFVILSMALPVAPPIAVAQAKVQDCVVCKRVCCCPDVCKAMMEKSAPKKSSHCVAKTQSTQSPVAMCDRPGSMCRLDSGTGANGTHVKENLSLSTPRLSTIRDVNPFHVASQEGMFARSLWSPSPASSLDVLTPPPRRIPA